MWGQEKKEEMSFNEQEGEKVTTVAPNSTSEKPEDINAFVGKGVEFKGTISYSGTVRIDGYLDGEIHTDGMLLIGEDAVIQAKITAGTIVSKGKITGEVVAKECIKLRAPAVMNGSVKTPVLSMEDGVLFNVDLAMTQDIYTLSLHDALPILNINIFPALKRANG